MYARISVSKIPPIIYIIYIARARACGRTQTDGAGAGDSIIYMYYCPRARVNVAHFPASISSIYRLSACARWCAVDLLLYVYMYIDILSLFRLALVLFSCARVWLVVVVALCSVLSVSVVQLALLLGSGMLSADITVSSRCNAL